MKMLSSIGRQLREKRILLLVNMLERVEEDRKIHGWDDFDEEAVLLETGK